MKKVIIIIIVVLAILYMSNEGYKIYSRSYVNSHESIVLINNLMLETEFDEFFNLEKGTFDPSKHRIIYSFKRKNASILDRYINLPIKSSTVISNNAGFNCDVEYQQIRHYNFYDYEIVNRNIIARLIDKSKISTQRLNANKNIAEKSIRAKFSFGKINVLDMKKNGIRNHCK